VAFLYCFVLLFSTDFESWGVLCLLCAVVLLDDWIVLCAELRRLFLVWRVFRLLCSALLCFCSALLVEFVGESGGWR
jgi:hypothetical protein